VHKARDETQKGHIAGPLKTRMERLERTRTASPSTRAHALVDPPGRAFRFALAAHLWLAEDGVPEDVFQLLE